MFSLFPQLPIDIRRKIWLTTLGPMTITLTQADPPPAERLEQSESSPTPFLPEESRYVGKVSLPDGSCKLSFAVKPSAAYLACRESRDFLHYIFAEPVKPDGGLPSWFDIAIDTVRFHREHLVPLSRHPWFKPAQHLWIRIDHDAGEYLSSGCYHIPAFEDKNHRWLENNLASLKSITFEMVRVSGEGVWVREWFPVFETWFNHARWDPVSFSARVICYQSDTPEEEWLTPQNYLRVEKQVKERHFQRGFGVPNWKEMIDCERTRCLVYATDEELENPAYRAELLLLPENQRIIGVKCAAADLVSKKCLEGDPKYKHCKGTAKSKGYGGDKITDACSLREFLSHISGGKQHLKTDPLTGEAANYRERRLLGANIGENAL
ncbi:hypothetical protein MY4038_010309 [Beauveria bassiana]